MRQHRQKRRASPKAHRAIADQAASKRPFLAARGHRKGRRARGPEIRTTTRRSFNNRPPDRTAALPTSVVWPPQPVSHPTIIAGQGWPSCLKLDWLRPRSAKRRWTSDLGVPTASPRRLRVCEARATRSIDDTARSTGSTPSRLQASSSRVAARARSAPRQAQAPTQTGPTLHSGGPGQAGPLDSSNLDKSRIAGPLPQRRAAGRSTGTWAG